MCIRDRSSRDYNPEFISKLVFIYELTCTSYWSADQTASKAYFCIESGDLIVHPNGAVEMDLSQVGHYSVQSELLEMCIRDRLSTSLISMALPLAS